jgi:hypothetical protein
VDSARMDIARTRGVRRAVMVAVLLAMLVPSVSLADPSLGQIFEKANQDYQRKNYTAARSGYETLASQFQIHNATIYYNLGNACFKQGALGYAILYFKRALTFDPSSELEGRIQQNLELTKDAVRDRALKDRSRPLVVLDETHGALYSIFHLLSAEQVALVFSVFWLLLFGALITKHFIHNSQRLRIVKRVAVVASVLTVLSGTLFAGNLITSEQVTRGIIVAPNATLQQGSVSKDVVPEGLEVNILDDTDPNETLIQLSNGYKGRVPKAAVQRISL